MKQLPLLALALAVFVPLASCKKRDATPPTNDASDVAEIGNKGSDTMLDAALAWREAYQKVNPKISISVLGGGTRGGVAGLIDGTVDIANASRAMTKEEIERARQRGRDPVQHHVGYDGIAVYVHRDNPIAKLTLAQLGEIYSDGGSITKWSQLGVKMPEGTSDDIVLISRQNNSGTYEYFREAALHNKDFRLEAMNANGSIQVVSMVAKTRGAIGYSGLAAANDTVRIVPIAKDDSAPPVVADINHVVDGSYPISRPLFMYTPSKPEGATKQYLDWILSDDGQRALASKGYPPLRKLN